MRSLQPGQGGPAAGVPGGQAEGTGDRGVAECLVATQFDDHEHYWGINVWSPCRHASLREKKWGCPQNTSTKGRVVRNRLVHYSSRPLEAVKSATQKRDPFGKPNGLWVSVGDAWLRFNRDRREDPINRLQLEACVYTHHIRLTQDANLLCISNNDEFDRFNAQYGRTWIDGNVPDGQVIDWTSVAEKHQGIIIAPYLRDKAEDTRGMPRTVWYWSWACASGCIWGAEAIACIVSELTPEQHTHNPV